MDFSSYNSFYFIVYSTNPDKHRVTFELDSNGIRQSLNENIFFDLIYQTCNLTLANKVKATFANVNETYLLDRENKTIKELINGTGPEKQAHFKMYQDKLKEKKQAEKRQDWVVKILNTQNSWKNRFKF